VRDYIEKLIFFSYISMPEPMDTNDNLMMKRLTKPLFISCSNVSVSSDVSPTDVTHLTSTLSPTRMENLPKSFAVTVNIKPTARMNGRQWNKYDHDKQRSILTRVEKAYRKVYSTVTFRRFRLRLPK